MIDPPRCGRGRCWFLGRAALPRLPFSSHEESTATREPKGTEKALSGPARRHNSSGAEGIRTPDLLNAIQEDSTPKNGQGKDLRHDCQAACTKTCTSPQPQPLPADLQRVVDAWDRLQDHIRAAILALISTAGKSP